VFGVKVCTGY